MDNNFATAWDVHHYGTIINDYESTISGSNIPLRLKVTRYEGQNYIELWEGGYCIHFSEAMD